MGPWRSRWSDGWVSWVWRPSSSAENRILKAQSKGRLQLSDAERATLGEIGHRLGRKILAEVVEGDMASKRWILVLTPS